MAENSDNRINGEEKLPEDFRPVIPEPEVRRRSIYDFSKHYPENDSPTSTHTESFAQQEFKRKVRRTVLYCLLLLFAFSAAFIITAASIQVSHEPLPVTTARPTLPPTFAATSEEFSESESESERESETLPEEPAATTQRETTTKAPTTQPETTTQPPTQEPTLPQEISTSPTTQPPTTNYWQGILGQ